MLALQTHLLSNTGMGHVEFCFPGFLQRQHHPFSLPTPTPASGTSLSSSLQKKPGERRQVASTESLSQ